LEGDVRELFELEKSQKTQDSHNPAEIRSDNMSTALQLQKPTGHRLSM